jgi:cytochrome c oxidase cbb3-type subunit 3/ubiquinol-cytochrome c reductase cytochrome c subunit
MNRRHALTLAGCSGLSLAFSLALPLLTAGCSDAPGKPGPEPEVVRPDHVLDFATLYKQNCVACHGDAQHAGPAIMLANPVYLAVAGEANLADVLNHGRPGTLMPAFGKVGGGLLTEQQVDVLAKGLISTWGKPGILDGLHAPGFKSTLAPNLADGQKVFAGHCASCHGTNGSGVGGDVKGSLVDPAFLGLISDQNLRSIVIAGMNSEMPNFHEQEDGAPALTDQNVTDVVAWLASHRADAAGAGESSSADPSSADQSSRIQTAGRRAVAAPPRKPSGKQEEKP